MKKLFILSFFFALTVSKSIACLNEYYSRDIHGEVHQFEAGHAFNFENPFYSDFNANVAQKRLLHLEQELKKKKDYKLLSNYAVQLMYGGKYKLAVQILEQLYIHYPDNYQIAANLGTAYELTGEVNKALIFIKKGLELNPDSHEKSEWVHVKILETKLELIKNKDYLATHTVLNLSEKDKKNPEIRAQIYHQMVERFPFSPSPDPIMANIFIDLGDCFAQSLSADYARALYNIAHYYFGADKNLISNRLKGITTSKQIQKENDVLVPHSDEIGYINYKNLIKSINKNNSSIEWKKIEMDISVLLSYIDKTINVEKTAEIDSAIIENKVIKKSTTEVSTSSNSTLYYGLGILLIVVFGFFLFKKYYTSKTKK